MEDHRRKLEYRCTCTQLTVPYAPASILWVNTSSRFEVPVGMSPQIGYFTIWVDHVDPDSLRSWQGEIMRRAKSFVLAMQYLGNAGLSVTDETLTYISASGEMHKIADDCDIEAIIRRARGEIYNYCNLKMPAFLISSSGYSSPVPLPQDMPSIPLILKRFIRTVLQAEALDSESEYRADEQLKRWFLIIEELDTNTADQGYKDLKCVRDFVSHSKVDHTKVIEFLKLEFPSSVCSAQDKKEEARYLRDDSLHQAFVSRYESIARQLAKRLVEEVIASGGGRI